MIVLPNDSVVIDAVGESKAGALCWDLVADGLVDSDGAVLVINGVPVVDWNCDGVSIVCLCLSEPAILGKVRVELGPLL